MWRLCCALTIANVAQLFVGNGNMIRKGQLDRLKEPCGDSEPADQARLPSTHCGGKIGHTFTCTWRAGGGAKGGTPTQAF